MKINAMTPISALEQYKAVERSRTVSEQQYVQQRDESQFSSDATLFYETLQTVKQQVSERFEKSPVDVTKIKQNIESGSYSVQTQELASSILMISVGNED